MPALTTIPFLAPTDHNKNELRNARIHVLSSPPPSPVSGQVYFDSVLLSIGWYSGTAWIYPAALEASSNPIALGTASPGTGGTGSKYDHVHPTTGLALLAGGNTLTGTQTIQTSGGLVVAIGNWRLDAQGRVSHLVAIDAATLLTVGGSTAHPGSATTLFGEQIQPIFPSTTTVAGVGLRTAVQTAAAAFTMGIGYGLEVDVPTFGAASAVTNLTGLQINNQGAGAVANALGLVVASQSGATTLNVAASLGGGTQANLWLNSDTATKAGGVAFGTARDTDLFRLASNSLKTSGLFTAGLGFDAATNRIVNVVDPINPQDAATKTYVDGLVQGATWKPEADYATTTTLPANTYANGTAGVGATLTGTANGALAAIDGQTPALNDRILVKNEASNPNNGLYVVTQVGTGGTPYILTRTTDMDAAGEIKGATVPVRVGTANANQIYIVTGAGPFTVGTTAITWQLIPQLTEITAGNGLTKTGNQIDVVGTANRISVAADSIDIDAAYVGQTSITTLGTITSGTWTGTTIALLNGGTGATTAVGARTNLGATGKASGNVGDGAATTIDFAHNLNTTDVTVFVRENTVPGAQVHPVIQVKDVNTVTLIFGTAPTSNQYRVTTIG